MLTDDIFMRVAIDRAWEYQLITYPNPAVGALVELNGRVLAVEAHREAGTSHAEVLALLRAYEELSNRKIEFNRLDANLAHNFLLSLPRGFFSNCSIYVTLEPCSHTGKTPSCATLLSKLKPKRVVVGTLDPIGSHSGGVELLKSVGVEVEVGVLEREAEELIEPFIIWQKRAFVIFKIAQTSNGRIGGGYLSSKESLTHLHKIRSKLSWLIIGGNTVRVDRPTLDCRFIGANPPDIAILSKKSLDEFDRTIPLFNIEDRRVEILSSDIFKKPSLILVEGGEGTIGALRDKFDWLLQYQTPKISSHPLGYGINLELEPLHQMRSGVDLALWSRFFK
jgi:diaminohydroxyphosphoribosylaminopyrimidine deaminase/5-amino-6-(5-phosphoribosylamino)uracil reductase